MPDPVSTPSADYIVDPIVLRDLTTLAPFFANPGQQKVFHAAEYDVICLRRDYGFEFTNLFDTMSAARTLGWPQVGLAAILETHFGVTMDKRFQRADWKRRPLTPEQLDYARMDTHYLLALRERQLEALTNAGCMTEAQEEFERLALLRRESDSERPDPAAFWRVKGARELTRATGRHPADSLCLSGTGSKARGSSSVQSHGRANASRTGPARTPARWRPERDTRVVP